MRYLLDTNVLSEAARPEPDAAVIEWLNARTPLECCISVLTLGEIRKGVVLLKSRRRQKQLSAWLETALPKQFAGRLLAVDGRVALTWGRIMAEGRQAGREPPVIDGLLLATAAVHDVIFVTRSERDCADRGVPVLNPWKSV